MTVILAIVKCRVFWIIKCFKERQTMSKAFKRKHHEIKALGKGTINISMELNPMEDLKARRNLRTSSKANKGQ